MHRFALMLAVLLVTPALAGIEIDTAPTGEEPISVEVLIYSQWVRVPHAAAYFYRGTNLELDGGDELFIRLNASNNHVFKMDNFDPQLPGPWTTNQRVQFESSWQLSQLTTTGSLAYTTSNNGAIIPPHAANPSEAGTLLVAQVALGILGVLLLQVLMESVKRRNAAI